jgi:hypothetical protein
MAALLCMTGCESTQSKSARLAKQAGGLAREGGVVVTRQNRSIEVVSTKALQDANGTAVVVALRNSAKSTLAKLPISVEVKGRGGKSLFANDAPGLETSLVQVPVIRPGHTLLWVNDQVSAAGRPAAVDAKVGQARAQAPATLPRIRVSGVKLREDPVDGLQAVGVVSNKSAIQQNRLVIFGVSRKGGRPVAAGRALVNRLKPHARARFQMFFIGDPRRGRLGLAAPPTVLKEGQE